jgi:hypothetical protein
MKIFKSKIFYIIVSLNILCMLYVFFGSITINGKYIEPLLVKLEKTTNVDFKLKTAKISLGKFVFSECTVTTKQKDILIFNKLIFTYDISTVLFKGLLKIKLLAQGIVFKSPSCVFLAADNIFIDKLDFMYTADKNRSAFGKGSLIAENITSKGEKALFKALGNLLNVRSLENLNIEKIKIDFELKLIESKLKFKNIELESKDLYIYGKGEYRFNKVLDFNFNASYQQYISEEPVLSKSSGWKKAAFDLTDSITTPKFIIKAENIE